VHHILVINRLEVKAIKKGECKYEYFAGFNTYARPFATTKNEVEQLFSNVEYVANSYGIQLYIDGEASGNILPFNESEIFYGTVGILHDFPRARRY